MPRRLNTFVSGSLLAMKRSCSVAWYCSVTSCSTASTRPRASVALTMKRWAPSRLAICISALLRKCTCSNSSVHRPSAKNCFHDVRPGTISVMPSILRMAGLALTILPYMSSVNRPTGIAS